MGIKDLLRQFESCSTPVSLTAFRGKRIAVDASGFLHKALYATAEDRVDAPNTNDATDQPLLGCDYRLYVDVIMHRVLQLLQHCGVGKVVMVFDGPRNAMKHETQQKRESQRQQQMQQAYALLQRLRTAACTMSTAEQQAARQQCIQHLQRGLGVEREMEMHCIAALLQLQQADAALGAGALEVVVAPMEADPQLAYLCAAGLCDAVLSDDSDLLAYSAACGCSFPIITKYDSRTHTAQVVDLAQSLLRDVNLHQQRSHNTPQQTLPQKSRAKLDFLQQVRTQLLLSFTSPRGASSAGAAQSPAPRGTVLSRSGSGNRMFVQLCILAGCDYADSIPSVGLMTALQTMIRFKDIEDDELRIKKICDFFRLSGKKAVPASYLQRVRHAEVLFYHQQVYDPRSNCVTHFTDARCVPMQVLQELQIEDVRVESLLRRWDCHVAHDTAATTDSSPPPPAAQEVFTGRWWLLKRRRGAVGAAAGADAAMLVKVAPAFPWQSLSAGRLPPRSAESKRCSAWSVRARLQSAYHQFTDTCATLASSVAVAAGARFAAPSVSVYRSMQNSVKFCSGHRPQQSISGHFSRKNLLHRTSVATTASDKAVAIRSHFFTPRVASPSASHFNATGSVRSLPPAEATSASGGSVSARQLNSVAGRGSSAAAVPYDSSPGAAAALSVYEIVDLESSADNVRVNAAGGSSARHSVRNPLKPQRIKLSAEVLAQDTDDCFVYDEEIEVVFSPKRTYHPHHAASIPSVVSTDVVGGKENGMPPPSSALLGGSGVRKRAPPAAEDRRNAARLAPAMAAKKKRKSLRPASGGGSARITSFFRLQAAL